MIRFNYLNVVLFLSFFGAFISLLLYNLVGASLIANAPQLIRDLLIIWLVFKGIVEYNKKTKKASLNSIYFILFLLTLLVIFTYNVSFGGKYNGDYFKSYVNNVRRFIMPLEILLFGVIYLKDEYSILFEKKIQRYLYVYWIFGLFEYSMPIVFWEKMNAMNYTMDAAFGASNELNTLFDSGVFYTWDTLFLWGEKARRLVSFYIEPTTTASLAIASVVFSDFIKDKHLLILSVLCGLLTFSKGFFIFILLYSFIVFCYKFFGSRFAYKILILIFLVLFVLIFIIGYILYNKNPLLFEFGFFAHLVGLYEYFNNFKFFGYGIAEVGSFRYNTSDLSLSKIGIESSLANLISQCGFFVLVLYYYSAKFIFKEAVVYYDLNVIVLFLMYMFVFSTSNSATGYSGNFLILLLIAFFYNKNQSGYEKDLISYTSAPLSSYKWGYNKN